MVPKFARIAVVVQDIDRFCEEVGRLIGTTFVTPSMNALFDNFEVRFGEHGLEPIEVTAPGVTFTEGGSLIEVAIDVADAETTKARLKAGGYEPATVSYLPVPNKNEYLFGREIHGLPLMVCSAGDNEMQMRADGPFAALADAPLPKIGCVTVAVDNVDAVAADLKRFLDMDFVPTDAGGLGSRALVGTHRVKLVEGATGHAPDLELPLLSIEFIHDDVEAARARFVAAGYPVLHERSFASGAKAYYFGATVQGMPVTIYDARADGEVLGAS